MGQVTGKIECPHYAFADCRTYDHQVCEPAGSGASGKGILSYHDSPRKHRTPSMIGNLMIGTKMFFSSAAPDPDKQRYRLDPIVPSIKEGRRIYNINLHEGEHLTEDLQGYRKLCSDYCYLHCTTSCFSLWAAGGKTNGAAKVIPAIKASSPDNTRAFFFDDNIELDGLEKSPGICNLRDCETGEFVSFAEGVNGFVTKKAARNTVVRASRQYRNVLVKANILDAMEDPDYFLDIIRSESDPSEHLIVYMDVNSTIVCVDTVSGKDMSHTILSTMSEFLTFTPATKEAVAVEVIDGRVGEVKKAKALKGIVKDVIGKDLPVYNEFWSEANVSGLITRLMDLGKLTWIGSDTSMTLDLFMGLFRNYIQKMGNATHKDGIASSWFKCFEAMKTKHSVILNSFGVDTRKVILASTPDENSVLQVAVNYDKWDQRDSKKFGEQWDEKKKKDDKKA